MFTWTVRCKVVRCRVTVCQKCLWQSNVRKEDAEQEFVKKFLLRQSEVGKEVKG